MNNGRQWREVEEHGKYLPLDDSFLDGTCLTITDLPNNI